MDEAASAGTAVGAEEAHAVEEDEERENFGVFDRRRVRRYGRIACERVGVGGIEFRFVEESGQSGIEFALDGRDRWLFVKNARRERFEGLGEGLESGEDVGVGGVRASGAKFRSGEGNSGKNSLLHVDVVARNFDVEKRRIGGELALMFVFVAMRGDEVAAIRRAVDGDFAIGAAADGANLFALGRAKTRFFALFTDRTAHGRSCTGSNSRREYRIRT